MKKATALLLTFAMILSLCACGGNNTAATTTPPMQTQEAPPQTSEPELNILGEWVSVQDNTHTVTFLEDSTCFYTGTPPTIASTNSFVIDAVVTFSGTVDEGEIFESLPPTEATEPEEESNTYKYTFEPEVAIITIYKSTSVNYEVITKDGKSVIATIDGEITFVRAEHYEEYHDLYLAEQQAKVDAFYAEGKDGRTELETDVTYEIQSGLNMTVIGCVDSPSSSARYLKIILENTSDTGIYIRQDGVRRDGVYYMEWASDVPANIEVKYFNGIPAGFIMTDNASTDASDYVFKQEELGDPTRYINCGNHIYLDPGEQGEYYLLITHGSIMQVTDSPAYAIITFDNYNFFCDLEVFSKTAQ